MPIEQVMKIRPSLQTRWLGNGDPPTDPSFRLVAVRTLLAALQRVPRPHGYGRGAKLPARYYWWDTKVEKRGASAAASPIPRMGSGLSRTVDSLVSLGTVRQSSSRPPWGHPGRFRYSTEWRSGSPRGTRIRPGSRHGLRGASLAVVSSLGGIGILASSVVRRDLVSVHRSRLVTAGFEEVDCFATTGVEDLSRQFFERSSAVVDVAGKIGVGPNFRFQTTGPKPRGTGVVNRWLSRLNRNAHTDGALRDAFTPVIMMGKPPKRLFHPRVVGRVLNQTR